MKTFLRMGALSLLLLYAPHAGASSTDAAIEGEFERRAQKEEGDNLCDFIRYWTQFYIEGGYDDGEQWIEVNYNPTEKLDCFSNLFLYLTPGQIDTAIQEIDREEHAPQKIASFFSSIIASLAGNRIVHEYIRLAKLNHEVARRYLPTDLGLELRHKRHCQYFYLGARPQKVVNEFCREMSCHVGTLTSDSRLYEYLQVRMNELAPLLLERESTTENSSSSESDDGSGSSYCACFARMNNEQRWDVYNALEEVQSMLA